MGRRSTFSCCRVWLAVSGIVLAPAGAALAQDSPPAPAPPSEKQPPPEEDAPPRDTRSIEEIRRELERDDPTSPTTRVEPSSEAAAVEFDPLLPPRGRLLPEGSYLMARTGILTRAESLGVVHFLPDPDPTRPRITAQPMMLLPSRVTERIEANLVDVQSSGPVEISGRVYVFEGRNFLMPTTSPFRTSATAAPVKAGLVREGAFIVSRLARISRSDTGGEWMVTFDSDRNGQMDPPMVLIPCRLLERLIRTAQSEGDAARIIISGQVYVYHDVNYLLPTVMLRPLPSENLSP